MLFGVRCCCTLYTQCTQPCARKSGPKHNRTQISPHSVYARAFVPSSWSGRRSRARYMRCTCVHACTRVRQTIKHIPTPTLGTCAERRTAQTTDKFAHRTYIAHRSVQTCILVCSHIPLHVRPSRRRSEALDSQLCLSPHPRADPPQHIHFPGALNTYTNTHTILTHRERVHKHTYYREAHTSGMKKRPKAA